MYQTWKVCAELGSIDLLLAGTGRFLVPWNTCIVVILLIVAHTWCSTDPCDLTDVRLWLRSESLSERGEIGLWGGCSCSLRGRSISEANSLVSARSASWSTPDKYIGLGNVKIISDIFFHIFAQACKGQLRVKNNGHQNSANILFKSPPWLCFSTCQGESLTKQWTYGPT